jgi:mycothiol synthase
MSQLFMIRKNLDELPDLSPPNDLHLRTVRPGEESVLAAVLTAAFGEEWTVERVRSGLTEAPDVDATWVVEVAGQLVATASCQRRDRSVPVGTVHWVAADPAITGKRLGYWVSLAVLQDFHRAGIREVNLSTDDHRRPAIVTYLNLGFLPWYRDDTHPERWQTVLSELGRGVEAVDGREPNAPQTE